MLVASFLVLAAVQAWPLPLHLSTHLSGDPGGDTGVYVWNMWVFGRELVDKRSWPLGTDAILAIGGRADLSQHNYTIALGVMALPLRLITDVVTAFNVIYLLNVALSGLGMFILARRWGRADGGHDREAWLAGVLFACSPFLVARSTAHFSLAAAAALPFLAYWVDRAWASGRARDGAIAGACLAWAAYSDLYYAVYGVLLGGAVLLGRSLSLDWCPRASSPTARRVVNALLTALVVAILTRAVTGIESFSIGGRLVSMRTLYTPVLALTILALVRLAMAWRPRASWTWSVAPRRAILALGAMVVIAAIGLSPEFFALAASASDGQRVTAPVLWRSSAPGVDLMSFLLPNPNHPLAPQALVDWFAHEPGRYEENVVSIPWIAMLVIAAAWRWAGERPTRLWVAVALGALALALGPFVRIAGVDLHLPTPWTFARYLPIIGDARVPSRFGVLVILAVSVLFARALSALRARFPTRARAMTWSVAGLLAFELLPAPRTLYSAEVPAVFDVVAADARDVRVLVLPFGVRDGLSSLGNFSARTQFHQTRHAKRLIGGYLSRVSDERKALYLRHPYVGALIAKSEGRVLDDAAREAAVRSADTFVRELNVGYVVIDRALVPAEFERFAIDTLHLRMVGQSGSVSLYVPGVERGRPVGP